MTRPISEASDSQMARLLENTRAPYPDLAVSFASATTALITGSLNSLCSEAATVLTGFSWLCVLWDGSLSWPTAFSKLLGVPAG